MEFRNINHWKTEMKKIAISKELDIQNVQQRYVLEEFAKKIGLSKYNDMFILKGGFVVSTLLGLDTRMTRDLDVTYRSTIYGIEEIRKILIEIIETETDSFFDYSLENIRRAQEDNQYSGFVAQIIAKCDNTRIIMKIDISNNTLIFPGALNSKLKSLFSNEILNLNTYTVENIIAEKYETTLDRGEYNTRMRDLFDIYLLLNENNHLIDNEMLAKTIIKVSENRDTLENLNDFDEIIKMLENSSIFNYNFQKYKEEQYPKSKITLSDIFEKFKVVDQMIKSYQKNNV